MNTALFSLWIAPGGHYDLTDEELWNTAEREALEETNASGLVLDPWHKMHNCPLDIDVHSIPARPERGEGVHPHFDCRYVFRAQQHFELILARNEIIEIAWRPLDTIQINSSLYPLLGKRNLFGL